MPLGETETLFADSYRCFVVWRNPLIKATMELKRSDLPSLSSVESDQADYKFNAKGKCLSWRPSMFKLCCGLSSMLLGMFRRRKRMILSSDRVKLQGTT